jgi:hypothetical protein
MFGIVRTITKTGGTATVTMISTTGIMITKPCLPIDG